ncbi:MAG TPA: hypothetical protein VKR30_04760 [Candidatus Limnocylindrales bacterium]|nr:hypothetical protein [Candidatus Limnocylindrales bacterium]
MFRYTAAPRRRVSEARPDGPGPFDGYPYLVSRIGQTKLHHIALVPATWSRARIVGIALIQAEANRFETSACFGPDDAVYVAANETRTWEGRPPTGKYVTGRLELPEAMPASDELAARLLRLDWFEHAHRSGGFLIGDGADRGPRASGDDRARLGGRGPEGLPSGLRRCPVCRAPAGEYLRAGIEVIRIHCVCDNHNRCVRCLQPLARRRLSAWFYDEADGQAWYLAAYAAFSHRCPDEP